jgi:prepilin-type N-terminal cleavage/methylation domain-containing protein
MSHRLNRRQRGFSLIESLIALVVTAFGLLAIAGVGVKLAHSEDIARQRGEAARLAQEKIEDLRGFTQISAAAGKKSWNGLASGTDEITDGTLLNGEAYRANTTFERSWTLLDGVNDAWRRLQVTVAWADSANGSADKQSLTFTTVISKTDPADVGSLAFPLPGNTTLKRPKNRSLNIPVPATDLGDGTSAVPVGKNHQVIFSNETGYVVRLCKIQVTKASEVNDDTCPKENAYVVAGYISLSGFSGAANVFPSGLDINTSLLSGVVQGPDKTICDVSPAEDQNTKLPIVGYNYYICVLNVGTAGAAWSGKLLLAAPALKSGTTDYTVCRFQFDAATSGSDANSNMLNKQPYVNVADSLDNQNYVLSSTAACPTIDGLKTTEHQVCRGSGDRGAECPDTGS